MHKLFKLKDRIIAKVFRILTLNVIFPRTYKKAAKKPVDPNKIVFVEIRLPAVSNSLKVIYDKLVSEYDFDVHLHFLLTNSERKHRYLRRCKDMLRDIATAKYVIISDSTNCIGSVDMRPETELVQLWHGCGAFKKFGRSTADLIFGESRKEQDKHPTNNHDTYITVSSPEVIWAYEEAMNPDKKDAVVATGCSRTDVFYDKEFINNAYETLYDVVPEAKGKKVILYAPTFRGRVNRAQTSKMLNIKMFYDNLGDDYIILFKHHPLVRKIPSIPNEFSSFAVDVSRLMEIDDLLCVSDICITDYSSLVYEYSLFERPIIFFSYDIDSYYDWRGFYYDYYEMSPGPVCTTNLEMIDYIKNIDTRFDKQRVKDFRYKFMRSCDGKSTERILETVIGKEILEQHKKENNGVQPFNLVPKSSLFYGDYLKKVESLANNKKLFRKEYEKYSSVEISKGKVIMLDCSNELIRVIKTHCPEIICLKTAKADKDKKYVEIIKQIATAEYIFIEKDNEFLDLLSLKDETQIVYIPQHSFPFSKFGRDTLDYRSGVYKEKYKEAPMFKKVDIVSAGNELFKDIYSDSLGAQSGSFKYFGDVKADCFFNKKFVKKSIKKLTEYCGELKGKKVLLELVARDGLRPPVFESAADSYLYEYLKDDYIILKYFYSNSPDGIVYTPTMESYEKGMFDVTQVLSEYEAIAVADVIIGSVTESFFSSFASGKPVFAYAPYIRRRLHNMQTNFKYEAILPCKLYTKPDELVNAILDVENYDYSKLNKFRETFIGNTDGKSAEKLLAKLGLIK